MGKMIRYYGPGYDPARIDPKGRFCWETDSGMPISIGVTELEKIILSQVEWGADNE